jgi:hypothetical protein
MSHGVPERDESDLPAKPPRKYLLVVGQDGIRNASPLISCKMAMLEGTTFQQERKVRSAQLFDGFPTFPEEPVSKSKCSYCVL